MSSQLPWGISLLKLQVEAEKFQLKGKVKLLWCVVMLTDEEE